MRQLAELFAYNKAWSEEQRRHDPGYFERLCAIQRPAYLWIGCADSRVPANTIIGLEPGEVFVHRNVGNIVRKDDPNCLSVLQYAIDMLKVEHVIVCGHYRCGGVQAASGPDLEEPLHSWLDPIRSLGRQQHDLGKLPDENARWDRMCELNVVAQLRCLAGLPVVEGARQRGQPLCLHGWIYDLHDGLLRDLRVDVD